MWDGQPPATAAKTLQKYVSELRKALPEPVLRTAGGGYVLDVDDDDLDARRFERLVADRRVRRARWRCGAATCWPTSPTSGSSHAERARLDELRLVAREAGSTRELARGRHAEVRRRRWPSWPRPTRSASG